MTVSFKISKTGRRLRPKPHPPPPLVAENAKHSGGTASDADAEEEISNKAKVGDFKTLSISSILSSIIREQKAFSDYEVSFTLNLFPDGFFIGKPTEEAKKQNSLQDSPKNLYPYNRASQTLFSSIELGYLPGDILDDMPSKYYNGAIVCEVCDFRNCIPEQGTSSNCVPLVKKVLLRMSLENIVKDIPSISDESWTYGDLMEIESRALKALQPKLCLDPKPMLDRLCKEPTCSKLNLNTSSFKRKVVTADHVTITPNSQTRGKKICIDRADDGASHELGDLGMASGQLNTQLVNENQNLQHNSNATQPFRSKTSALDSLGRTLPVSLQSQCQPPGDQPRVQGSQPMVSPGVSDLSPYTDNFASGIHRKREAQDMQLTNASKRSRQTLVGQEGNQKLTGLQVDGANGEVWRNTMLRQDVKGVQYLPGMTGGNRQPIVGDIPNPELGGGSFHPDQQGMTMGIKQEQPDADKLKSTFQVAETESNQGIPPQLHPQQLAQKALLARNQFTQHHLNNLVPAGEKETRKEEMLPKRKGAQNSRGSATLVQSPVSSKSGEFSTASVFGSQKEKATTMSASAVGTPSSSPSDSLQRIPQAPTGKVKKVSTSKAAHISGVPSPASVTNITAPLGANSPSLTAASMTTTDPAILERFSKIEMITQRSRLNNKKPKDENFNVKKSGSFSTKELSYLLSNLLPDDFINTSRKMSGSIFQGSINSCKSRLIKSKRPHSFQESKLHLIERPSDGSVAMCYNESTDDQDGPCHDCLFTLPNTLYADLLADQYVCLMTREGCRVLDDTELIQSHFKQACDNPFVSMAMLPDSVLHEGQQPEGISRNQANLAAGNIMNQQGSSQNISNGRRMPLLGNNQGLPMSQGYLQGGQNFTPAAVRAQQLEQSLLQQQHQLQQQQQLQNPQAQIQQQQPQAQMQQQLQRSQTVLQMNPLSQFIGQNSNMQIGSSQMVSKASQIQLQALHQAQQQQQQQQQQQAQLSKKPVMGMSLGNNMMGLGGLGNVMSMGGVRGMSSSMSPMAGLTNMGPNPMNLGSAANFSVGFRPGSINAHSAMLASKMRLAQAQNRGNLFGAQAAGMAGLPGSAGMTGQVLPNTVGMSLLSQTLNRPNVNSLQRTVMSTMGPPKFPGANIYMNPQQLQIQQQLQQQQLQQLQQQQEQQQQQQISSPLQQPQVSSPAVGSPPMSMQQQMTTQQQTLSPQQLSAGALQQMNTNSGAAAAPGPASPQLSSQTHGSIGSISSSPMEQLQGNK